MKVNVCVVMRVNAVGSDKDSIQQKISNGPATSFFSFRALRYTMTTKIHQTNQDTFFHIIEKAVWSSGASNSHCFVFDTDGNFITLDVHNYKNPGDIVTDLVKIYTRNPFSDWRILIADLRLAVHAQVQRDLLP